MEAFVVDIHVVKSSVCCRWVSDLLSMLTAHTNLHWPLYMRLKELLTTQVGGLEDIWVIVLYSTALAISCLR